MKRLLTTLLVYLFINSYNLNSQTIYSVDKWMEYIEEMASETEDEAQIENLYSDLSYLSEHPFELNSVTETELKRLPFLSDQQLNSLLAYRVKYGRMWKEWIFPRFLYCFRLFISEIYRLISDSFLLRTC